MKTAFLQLRQNNKNQITSIMTASTTTTTHITSEVMLNTGTAQGI